MRILVVEDDAKLAGLIRRGLIDEGMQADMALSGEEALELGAGSRYDVIVLDLMLPGIDGVETARALGRLGAAGAILMITAGQAAEESLVRPQGPADEFLRKPFDFDELVSSVCRLAPRGAA
jgi:two-component system, OmpR family, response regulator